MLRRYLLSIQHLQSLGNMNYCRPVLLLPPKIFLWVLSRTVLSLITDGPQEYRPGYFRLRCREGSTPSEKATKPAEKFLVATAKLVDNGSYSLETEDVEWKEGNGLALTETVIQANVPDLSCSFVLGHGRQYECWLFTPVIFFANSIYVSFLYT